MNIFNFFNEFLFAEGAAQLTYTRISAALNILYSCFADVFEQQDIDLVFGVAGGFFFCHDRMNDLLILQRKDSLPNINRMIVFSHSADAVQYGTIFITITLLNRSISSMAFYKKRTFFYILSSVLLIGCNSASKNKNAANIATNFNPVQPPVPAAAAKEYTRKINNFYDSSLRYSGFNGAMLVAKNGYILFEKYNGLVRLRGKDSITASTPFHIASTSKTFTAMAVLKLAEEGKLNINDSLQKFFPGFPYSGITVKMLLNQRSGLPNYGYYLEKINWDKSKNVTNKDVLQYMISNRPAPESNPDRRYSYCNTNYVLLALIIEQVTKMSYPDYLRIHVFEPLGMTNSYVFSLKDASNYVPSYNYNNAPFPLQKLDCVYGDKNVYSTVRDLLQWDRALYLGTYVSTATLEMAYQPYSNETRGQKNYGLGWHLYIKPPDPTIVYHNGWWHGNNAVFKRLVADTATVIILGNKFNRNIWSAGKMSSVFTGHADTALLD